METYSDDLRKEKTVFKKKMQQEQKEYNEKLEKEAKLKADLIHASFVEEQRKAEKRQQELEIYITEAHKYLYEVAREYTYKEYITAWDIVNKDYYRLRADLQAGKINIELLNRLTEKALGMFSNLDFHIEYITE